MLKNSSSLVLKKCVNEKKNLDVWSWNWKKTFPPSVAYFTFVTYHNPILSFLVGRLWLLWGMSLIIFQITFLVVSFVQFIQSSMIKTYLMDEWILASFGLVHFFYFLFLECNRLFFTAFCHRKIIQTQTRICNDYIWVYVFQSPSTSQVPMASLKNDLLAPHGCCADFFWRWFIACLKIPVEQSPVCLTSNIKSIAPLLTPTS